MSLSEATENRKGQIFLFLKQQQQVYPSNYSSPSRLSADLPAAGQGCVCACACVGGEEG